MNEPYINDDPNTKRTIEIPEVDIEWQNDSPLPPPSPKVPSNAMASGALVCGILSVVISLLSPLICWVLGGVAIGLSTSSLRRNNQDGMARAARILGVIGVIAGVAIFLVALVPRLMATASAYGF